jgi:hypothetical protein
LLTRYEDIKFEKEIPEQSVWIQKE